MVCHPTTDDIKTYISTGKNLNLPAPSMSVSKSTVTLLGRLKKPIKRLHM